MSWRNPFEKRQFVNPKTGEPAGKIIQGEHGEVIGRAQNSSEVHDVLDHDNEGLREAA